MRFRRLFRLKKKRPKIISNSTVKDVGIVLSILILIIWFFPHVFSYRSQFPITVNPHTKKINESHRVNILLANKYDLHREPKQEKEKSVTKVIGKLLTTVENINNSAGVSNAGGRMIEIKPGMRKEQVASVFSKALGWNATSRAQFLAPLPDATLQDEGTFLPGTYFVHRGMTPQEARAMIHNRFTKEIISKYSKSIEEKVPLEEALIIASIIQRETIGTDDMRLVSGVIWNRLFMDMNLQMDATLQYAKADSGISSSWWPTVISYDKYLYSPYNTYLHKGLPPQPIANPSVAAIVAALNPIETECIFYFNDPKGNIHCSKTYEEHRLLLKEYY